MKKVVAGLLVVCALGGVTVAAANEAGSDAAAKTRKQNAENSLAPVVSNAWISEAPPVAKNNAAFITVKNSNRKDVLLGVETPAAESAEFHQMSMAGAIMRMQYLPRINLAPNAALEFAPGGLHIMLINMKQPLKVGDKVPLTLKFRKAGPVTVQAEVRALDVDAATAGSVRHSAH